MGKETRERLEEDQRPNCDFCEKERCADMEVPLTPHIRAHFCGQCFADNKMEEWFASEKASLPMDLLDLPPKLQERVQHLEYGKRKEGK